MGWDILQRYSHIKNEVILYSYKKNIFKKLMFLLYLKVRTSLFNYRTPYNKFYKILIIPNFHKHTGYKKIILIKPRKCILPSSVFELPITFIKIKMFFKNLFIVYLDAVKCLFWSSVESY